MSFILGLFIGALASAIGFVTWGYKAVGEEYRGESSNVGAHVDEHEKMYNKS